MADIGNQLVGTGINMGVGRALGAAGLRLPVPIPSFYNPNSEHHFRDSQLSQLLHGDRRAWGRYGGRAVGSALGNAILPVFGGMLGGWLGGKIGDRMTAPRGEVTVGAINTDGSEGGQTFIDPDTGHVSYMPQFSDYGPYAGGYRGPAGQNTPGFLDHGTGLPDFSSLGDYYEGNVDESGAPMNNGGGSGRARDSGGNMGEWGIGRGANGELFVTGGNGRGIQPGLGSGQKVYKKRDVGN